MNRATIRAASGPVLRARVAADGRDRKSVV